MEWKSGFLISGGPLSAKSGGSGTLGPLRDSRSRDMMEWQLPPRDERISPEFWGQQQPQAADGNGAEGGVGRTGHDHAGSGWGSAAAFAGGGDSSGCWNNGGRNDCSQQSSSGWGEAVASRTVVESTTRAENGGRGAPFCVSNSRSWAWNGGGGDGWGANKANNSATGDAVFSESSNLCGRSSASTAKDGDVMQVDGPTPRSRHELGRLFQFSAKISQMPCQCLETWFIRNKIGGGIAKTCFNTWNVNPAIPHQPKWVSIFTSPVDGETFISGQWKGSASGYEMIKVAAVDGANVLIPCYCKCVYVFW